MKNIDTGELIKKRICHVCIGEKFLSRQVRDTGRRRKCSYCYDVDKTILLDDLAGRIQTAFEHFYERTSEYPDSYQSAMIADPEFNYDWDRAGDPINYAIQDVAGISEEAACDIQQILEDRFSDRSADEIGEETEFADSSYYQSKGVTAKAWEEEWDIFESSLKTETRYFNQMGEACLQRVFDGLNNLKTENGDPVVVTAGTGHGLEVLYRARSFQSNDTLKLALSDIVKYLGPPAYNFARAGRMNAVGISVFYGATDEKTALAEVRPPVGSKVAIARFKIIRNLRLFNLQSLSDLKFKGSVFDPTYTHRLGRIQFIRQLCSRMTVPVMPDDENTEYLITQAIADYLSKNIELDLDGIIFPSIQAGGGGSNIILFHKASKVVEREIPRGTKISVSLVEYDEDGAYPHYTIFEETPSKNNLEENVEPLIHSGIHQRSNQDNRTPGLSIDEEFINIHTIKGVAYSSDSDSLSIYRHEKVNWKDDGQARIDW